MGYTLEGLVQTHSPAKGAALKVLLFLAGSAKQGESLSWHSYSSIAEKTRISKRQVIRVIIKLKELSAINEVKKVVDTQYNSVLTKSFPDIDLNKVKMTEKERLYTAVIYYNPELQPLDKQYITRLKNNPPKKWPIIDRPLR